MYGFMWRPRWIISHVLVLALIVAMVNLGLWQRRRLHQRLAENALIVENTHKKPVDVDVFGARVGTGALGTGRYTAVFVRGTYDTAHEVAIRDRTLNGAPGRWIATPLIPSGGGTAVLVMRGWVPEAVSGTSAPFAGVEPPAGEVTVTGFVQPTQTVGTFGAKDAATGVLGDLNRLDVARIARQTPEPLLPFWIQMSTQHPATTSAQIGAVALPPLDEGPYRSYMWQWALFTVIAIVGYPLVLYRIAHGMSTVESPDDDDAAGDGGDGEGGGGGGGGPDGGDGDGDGDGDALVAAGRIRVGGEDAP